MSASGRAFRLTHDLVAQFLATNGYQESLDKFCFEGGDFVSVTRECAGEREGAEKPLVEIVTEYMVERGEGGKGKGDESKEKLEVEESEPLDPQRITCQRTLDTLHGGNVLCVKSYSIPELSDDRVIITSSTDKTVKVSLLNSGQFYMELTNYHIGGAVLNFDVHPTKPYVLTSSMDFTVVLTDITTNDKLASWDHHTKFVPHAKFSPDGTTFVTGSYDHTVSLYRVEGDKFTLERTFDFTGNVEALCYTPDSHWVVVGIRDDNYLHYIDLTSCQVNKFNMNANGDDIVSFTVMDLLVSPNGKYLLAATDHRSGRVLLFKLFSNLILRNYYGVPQDEFSTPRLAWHPTGQYFFVTGDDFKVHLYDVLTCKRVGDIPAHSSIVRSLHVDPTTHLLLSGSFDRTVKLWNI